MIQYVSVKFRPTDERSYLYHNDGESLRVGDRIKVPTRRGPQTVEVIGISGDMPPFATKPTGRIMKRARPEPVPVRDEEFIFRRNTTITGDRT